MMRAGGTVAMAVATLLACCSADPHQDQDVRVGGHNIGDRYNDINDFRQSEELENFLKFLTPYEIISRNNLLAKHTYETNPMQRPTGGFGFLGGSLIAGKNYNGIGESLGRNMEDKMQNARFVDPLGGGNFVRNLDSLGGGNFVRNLDSIGGANFVRNLDSIGGANFVRNLDSIGGANFVRNLDSIGGANFVKKNLDHIGGPNLVKRNLDSLGGGNLVRNLDTIGGGNFVRQVDPLGGGNFV